MEMTQMHLWQAQAMEGMDEDFGDGKSVSLFKSAVWWMEGCMWMICWVFLVDTCSGRIQNLNCGTVNMHEITNSKLSALKI